MKQDLKRLFSSTILFTGLMVCLTDQNACEVTAKSTNSIQTTKSKDNVVEIKIPAVAGVTINNEKTVSIEFCRGISFFVKYVDIFYIL